MRWTAGGVAEGIGFVVVVGVAGPEVLGTVEGVLDFGGEGCGGGGGGFGGGVGLSSVFGGGCGFQFCGGFLPLTSFEIWGVRVVGIF